MAVDRVMLTTMGPMALGSMCLKAILVREMPKARRDWTNSSSRRESTLLRAMRYMDGQPVRMKMTIRFCRLLPTRATMMMIITIWGMDMKMSAIFIRILSSHPPR